MALSDTLDYLMYKIGSDVNRLFTGAFGLYNFTRTNKDSNDVYTTMSHYRHDNTLYIQEVLSGGTSPEYTTLTVTVYQDDGVTLVETFTFALAYDVSGNMISRTLSSHVRA